MGDIDRIIEQVERSHSESTGTSYASALRGFRSWYDSRDDDILAATSIDIEAHLSHLYDDRDFAYSSIRVRRAAISSFFDSAEKLANAGKIETHPADEWNGRGRWENPTDDVDLTSTVPDKSARLNTKKERALSGDDRHALSESEIEQLIDNLPAPRSRNELLFRMAYQAMLRMNEILNLRLEDIDREERSITIRPEISKNGKERVTYYMPSLDSHLTAWLDVDREAYNHVSDSEYIFLSNENEKLSESRASFITRKAAEGAGLDDILFTDAKGGSRRRVTFHSLRHSGAVRRWGNGADLRTLQVLLGHQDISTTQQYLDVSDESVEANARQYW